MHAHVRSIIDDTPRHVISAPTTFHDVIDAQPIVYVIDDDVSVRESLESVVGTMGCKAAGFISAEDFLAHPRGTGPCCVIADLTLPGLSGLELQRQLAGRVDVPIVFIAGYTDVPATVQAMKAGAVEFLMKPLRTDLLVSAVDDAIARSRTALRLRSERETLMASYESLTPREREVMTLVASGLLNKQVGFELGITEATVKAHRGQVMRKMQAGSLPELVTMATRLGFHLPPHRSSQRASGRVDRAPTIAPASPE